MLLAAASAAQAVDLSIGDLTMAPGSTATVVASGTIAGESTYAVNIYIELVPRAGATGTVVFTPEPPVDISYLGDPWPPPMGGLYSKYDTLSTFSSTHNGSIDDNGTLTPGSTTYSGLLSGFPVQASADATGVWDVTLTTSGAPPSNWEGQPTTLFDGVITICGDGVTDFPEACDDVHEGLHTAPHDNLRNARHAANNNPQRALPQGTHEGVTRGNHRRTFFQIQERIR